MTETRIKTVAISGASGLVGQALTTHLEKSGWQTRPMVRRASSSSSSSSSGSSSSGAIPWDPAGGVLEASDLEGLDAVIHLAGENIFGRWTAAKKKRILESRIQGTRLVSESLVGLARPPKVLVSASAIGFYGDRGDEVMSEEKAKGDGFLADVCWRWEGATAAAREAGVRVVNLRIGIVLSREGGALGQMLTPFRLGMGGRLGDGQQWFSWIHCDDLVAAIHFALKQEDLAGPVNAAAPEPVRNIELTEVLGRLLHRPTFLPAPKLALKLALGSEMAEETLLASTRVRPKALEDAGFEFTFPRLEGALRRELED